MEILSTQIQNIVERIEFLYYTVHFKTIRALHENMFFGARARP